MTVIERKKREREARSALIIKVARKIFSKKGIKFTSMAEIAEAAEIGKGSIYLYFKSKQELAYAVMEPMLEQYGELLDSALNDEDERADKALANLVDFVHQTYPKTPEPYQLFLDYKAEDFHELFLEHKLMHLKHIIRNNYKKLEGVIAKGINQGIFKPVDPWQTCIIIWSLIFGIMRFEQNRTYGGKKDHLKATLDAGMNLLVKGLMA